LKDVTLEEVPDENKAADVTETHMLGKAALEQ
jgi:hypothetical protein